MGNWFSSDHDSSDQESPRSRFAIPTGIEQSATSRSAQTQDSGASPATSSSGGMRKIETAPNTNNGYRGGTTDRILK